MDLWLPRDVDAPFDVPSDAPAFTTESETEYDLVANAGSVADAAKDDLVSIDGRLYTVFERYHHPVTSRVLLVPEDVHFVELHYFRDEWLRELRDEGAGDDGADGARPNSQEHDGEHVDESDDSR